MAFLLHHPELRGVSCAECKKWMVNIKTGKFEEWPKGSGRRIPRNEKIPTPCHECPKGSPDREHEVILSPKNWQALQLYAETQGTCGQALVAFGADSIIRRNFSVLHSIFEQYHSHQLNQALSPLAITLAAMTGPRTPTTPRRR